MKRLQFVFGRVAGQTDEHRDDCPCDLADQNPERREVDIARGQRSEVGDLEHDLSRSVFFDVEPGIRRATRDSRGQIEKISVTAGSRTEHGVGEDDRVGFGPRDLVALRRPVLELVRCAGKARFAAEQQVRFHEPLRVGLDRTIAVVQLRVNQIERADVERGGHGHLGAGGNEELDEVEARLSVVKTAVDMGRGDVDQAGCRHHVRGPLDDSHRTRRPFSELALQHRRVAIA